MPIIGVGNLSAGGTGKSPMVEYLIALLKDEHKIATLSRGYKRKTKGFLLTGEETTASEIGDEPMQFHRKFPEVAVAVGEERISAIPKLLQERPETDVIILDDAFQHRSVTPGLNILLTRYGELFTRDFFLPTGYLRDQKNSYRRADVIVVTKCPFDLSREEGDRIKTEINPFPPQKVFFATTEYGIPYHIFTGEKGQITANDELLLVCGIANPTPLKNYLSPKVKSCIQLSFPDHHHFTINDIKDIRKKFSTLPAGQKMIITTEKDAVRLVKFAEELINTPLFVIPIQHKFLFDEGIQFDCVVHTFMKKFPADKKSI